MRENKKGLDNVDKIIFKKKGLKVSKVDLRFGKIFLCEIVDVDHFEKYLKNFLLKRYEVI